jgi:hypothetical protein
MYEVSKNEGSQLPNVVALSEEYKRLMWNNDRTRKEGVLFAREAHHKGKQD